MPPLIAAAGTALSGWVAAGGIAAAATQLAIGAGLTLASRLIVGGPPTPEAPKTNLPVPSSRPEYRFNYGERFVDGSPMWWRKDGKLYLCAILNSRPSAGSFAFMIDKRPVTLKAGNIFDFNSGGVEVSSPERLDGYAYLWIGRGDQVSPPADILAGDGAAYFNATDGWRGRTVLWARFQKGAAKDAAKRWPNGVPVVQVSAQWSRVWDPRISSQDPDNPNTWTWSANQALCVLDALRTNPIRRWPLSQLLLPSFIDAANVADENVARIYPAGTEKRYRVDGQIIFRDGELEAQIEPLLAAGASRLTHIGGKLGIVPGAWSAPVYTASATIGPPAYERWKPGKSLTTGAQLSYVDAEGDEQLTPLPVYEVPGAISADGEEKIATDDLAFVMSPGQGQRVQKIRAMRARAQRSLICTLPPAAFNVVAGSNITVALPAPYTPANGVYEVTSSDPGVFLREDGGVAMRVEVEATETSEAVYAWSPATEEREMAAADYDPNPPEIERGGVITAAVGPSVSQDTGGSPINRIRFQFDPSPTYSVDGYEWEFRVASGDWESGGFLDAETLTSGGKIRGYLSFVKEGETYAIRVRATAGGSSSDLRTLTGIVAGSAT